MSCLISRSARMIFAVLAACLLFAGCGSGPSKIGAAAIVGDKRIPVSTVDAWFSDVLEAKPGISERLREQGRMDDLARQLAGISVRQELARQAAEYHELSVSEQQVTQWIKSRGGVRALTKGTILTPDTVRSVARTQVLLAELGRKYLPTLTVTFDYTQANTREEAKAKARRMAKGPKAAAALIAADRAAGISAGTGKQIQASQAPKVAASTPLFGAHEGTVVAFKGPRQRSGTWLIARITERSSTPTGQQAQVPKGMLGAFGLRLLGYTAERVDVNLSPRYGAWDPIKLSTAPAKEQTAGFRISDGARG